MLFIKKTAVSTDRWRDVTYGQIVVDYRPDRTDPYRTRLTVGGDIVSYPRDCGTPKVDFTTVKLLLNSIV